MDGVGVEGGDHRKVVPGLPRWEQRTILELRASTGDVMGWEASIFTGKGLGFGAKG